MRKTCVSPRGQSAGCAPMTSSVAVSYTHLFQTLEDGTVTLRDRDSMQQVRLSVPELIQKLDTEIG